MKVNLKIKKIRRGVPSNTEDLELGVIPQGTFLQKIARGFRPEKKEVSLFDYINSFEYKLISYSRRMELIRTITTLINCAVSIYVLLKVFKVI